MTDHEDLHNQYNQRWNEYHHADFNNYLLTQADQHITTQHIGTHTLTTTNRRPTLRQRVWLHMARRQLARAARHNPIEIKDQQ